MTIMYCVYRHLRLLPKGYFVKKKRSPCFCVIVYSKSILIKITIRTLTSFSNQDSLAITDVELGIHTTCIYKVDCHLDFKKTLLILRYLVSWKVMFICKYQRSTFQLSNQNFSLIIQVFLNKRLMKTRIQAFFMFCLCVLILLITIDVTKHKSVQRNKTLHFSGCISYIAGMLFMPILEISVLLRNIHITRWLLSR